MRQSTHPLSLDPDAVRLLEHSLLDIEQLLGADSFSIDGDEVVFRRRSSHQLPAVIWRGRVGDWLVRDGDAHWRIVSDQPLTLDHRPDAPVRSTAEPSEVRVTAAD